MTTPSLRIWTTLATLTLAAPLLTGCHVTENEHDGSQNVSIGTPFGSMKVNTGNSLTPDAIGISPYPGAQPVSDHGDDSNNANVQMSFGSFRLGVKVAELQTPASQQQVLVFYRKDLSARYGAPIECRGQTPIGTPDRTPQGLTCKDQQGVPLATSTIPPGEHSKGLIITSDDSSTQIDLRAGSPQRMHVVSVEPRDGGTRISLVSIDLPSHNHPSNSE
ncbi:MAG: hypothetical protein ACP5E5_05835 [Acidobacteriaceae bacterium]